MPPIRSEFREALVAKILEYELVAAETLILERSAECVRVDSDGPELEHAVGRSRFGGDPDLPQGVAWPMHVSRDGSMRHANFLCQINFAELPAIAAEPALPERGLLLVFLVSLESAAASVVFDTIYFEGDPKHLSRCPAPPHEQLLDDEYLIDLKPTRVAYRASYDCEIGGRSFARQLALLIPGGRPGIDAAHDRFRELCFGLPSRGMGQIIGFANTNDDNLQRQVALSALGARQHQYYDHWDSWEDYEAAKLKWAMSSVDYEAMRPGVEWLLANAARIDSECKRWQHLLCINSNREMDLWINDADPVYAFVSKSSLEKCDFGNLRGEVTQG